MDTPLSYILPSNQGDLPSLLNISGSHLNHSYLSRRELRAVLPTVLAPPICSYSVSPGYMKAENAIRSDLLSTRALFGLSSGDQDSEATCEAVNELLPGLPPAGLIKSATPEQLPPPTMQMPQMKRLIFDAAKLNRLDSLLRELKPDGHRVLIYFQMTKMIDLIEEYLVYRQYKYLRLDGSSKIEDRRDMVTSWQSE